MIEGQLPEKTVERLSKYRRVLLSYSENEKNFIFSHELAALLHITPVQVRRDIMLIGYSATQKKGYEIAELIILIGEIIDSEIPQKTAVIGVGNLGKAIIGYLNGKRKKFEISACFDVDADKVGKVISGVKCYHINEMEEVIKRENISIGVLTVPKEFAVKTAEKLVMAGIKGILNYTPVPVNVGQYAYLEEYDMITSIEKVAYYVKDM